MDVLRNEFFQELGLQRCAFVIPKGQCFGDIRLSFVLVERFEGPFGSVS